MCEWCKRLDYSIKHKKIREKNNKKTRIFFSPNKNKNLQKIKNVQNLLKRKYTRATRRITCLKSTLNSNKEQMKIINETNINTLIENNNILKCQSDLIHEIFKAAKVTNTKQRRYSDNWILLCMLLQIRYIMI